VSKKKLQHFAENATFPNFFQLRFHELMTGFQYKGNWQEYFQNARPIVVELGCGKGEYTVNMAEFYPGRNYIGMDVKGARMWRGCKTSIEKGLTNVAFIRTFVQLIYEFFAPGEVEEIWITFPDPQPRQSRERKRLTAPRFLDLYRKVLRPDGIIHLKTDNYDLYQYTLEVIREGGHKLLYATHDVYHTESPEVVRSIQTFYEKRWLAEGKLICYLEFELCQEVTK
jgi:tRNA (guanine-N7-)-methyltransferase